MKLTGVNRNLANPTPRERELLEIDLEENDIPSDLNQHSFLNSLTNDLEAKIVQVNKNTNQKIIIVTQDKALLTLKKNLARLGKKEWIAPLSTSLTILLSLITSNFKIALGLGPAEWRAIFIVSGFLATGWLAAAVFKSLNAKSFHEVVHDVIFDLCAKKRLVDDAQS